MADPATNLGLIQNLQTQFNDFMAGIIDASALTPLQKSLLTDGKSIDGFFIPKLTGGRTTWQNGDEFIGYVGNRFVAGRVIDATGLNMPGDIDTNKIAIAIDGEI